MRVGRLRHIRLYIYILLNILIFLPITTLGATRTAQYAQIDYDVVYVRCPRASEPVNWMGSKDLLNWNGINDIWLSAANNIYQQPGCDLVLHHSSPGYGGGLPLGHPAREEVLVECDETNTAAAVCTVADPNVSFDGKSVVFAKFTDTRAFVDNIGLNGDGGWGPHWNHRQSYVEIYSDGSGPGYGRRFSGELKPYNAPVLIYRYDLVTKTQTQVSPPAAFYAGRAHPNKDTEWSSNIPVMDTGPFFMPDGRVGFTSNRDNGFYRFQLFAMDADGKNLELLGHRAMNQQLHPAILKDGRIGYTSFDAMLQKESNNQYSLFTINPDGSFPFILAGKHDATHVSYHFMTQLSDGDVVVTLYYNHNNGGMGTLLRFPIDPPGADFEHGQPDDGVWRMGNDLKRFHRVGEFNLTPQASSGDSEEAPYANAADFWIHPSRAAAGRTLMVNGVPKTVDTNNITMRGRFTHPSGAPNNDLLVTYTIGGSSTMGGYESYSLDDMLLRAGKDAGIWLLPLEVSSNRQIGHIADDGRIVVDFPEYQEIMARPVVTYARTYTSAKPGVDDAGQPSQYMAVHENLGTDDVRLQAGGPYGLSGASSMYDRETRAANGTPWNMRDGGGQMSGRTYTNLGSSGAELAIFNNEEVYGVRVLMPMPGFPNGYGSSKESWAGHQKHHTRILGEFPVRKPDGTPLDVQGNPDTSFIVKIPADTPFLFQTLDKRGMALDIETSSRTVARGEQQLCIGCHVHTREGMDPFASAAKLDTQAPYGDFSGQSAPLFVDVDGNGEPIVATASTIYSEALAPGVNNHRSFAVDWVNGVSTVIQNRCASCHAEGQNAQQLTGLRLDGDQRTYDLLTRNSYTREDGMPINDATRAGDGLDDVRNNTPNTDRITPRYSCCTSSRWLSYNSARSSMLIWALYGERLDGRDPGTGLPPAGSGVLVDTDDREHPEIWPKVSEHAAYVASMPEAEKRLLARWIDLGAPLSNVHDDMMRPVLTITPVLEAGQIHRVLVGVWDDSPLDYSKFKVTANGSTITPPVNGKPDVISVVLPVPVTANNADSQNFEFEIWDKPNRELSLVSPGVAAANRTKRTLTGRALLRMADASPNSPPQFTHAQIETWQDTPSLGVIPVVTDPDAGDSHIFTILTQPAHGSAVVSNNRLVYTPSSGYIGQDSFIYRASDLVGASVVGTADVVVTERSVTNNPPTSTSAIIVTSQNTVSAGILPAVIDPDVGDNHNFLIVSQPVHGNASVVDNRLVYTPQAGYFGGDSFIYRATDQGGASVNGTATVTVTQVGETNHAPSAVSAHIETRQDTASDPVMPTVLDPDVSDSHTFSVFSQPAHGQATIAFNRVVYTPQSGYYGNDSFVILATDSADASVLGVVTVSVTKADTTVPDSVPNNGGGTGGAAGDSGATEQPAAGSVGPIELGFYLLLYLLFRRRCLTSLRD